ncbi:MAG: ATP-binding protein [Oleibacter sp.]|nr:ATP-binding protein [Thalassolituus sp.]
MIVRFLLILLTILSCPSVAIELDDDISGKLLGTHGSIWQESKPIVPISSINDRQLNWQPSNTAVINPGVSNAHYWYRLEIDVSESPQQWRIVIDYPQMDKVEVLLFHDDKLISQSAIGDKLKTDDDTDMSIIFSSKLNFENPGKYVLYARAHQKGVLLLSPRLIKDQSFDFFVQSYNLKLGLYTGFLTAILFYNLVVYIFILKNYILLFCGFVASYIGFYISMSGIGYRYIWIANEYIEERSAIVLGALALIFLSLFIRHFGKPYFGKNKILIKSINLNTLIAIAALISCFIPNFFIALYCIMILSTVFCLIIFIFSSLILAKRRRNEVIFALVNIAFAVSLITHNLMWYGYIDIYSFMQNSTYFALIISCILYTGVIILRFMEERKKQESDRKNMIIARKDSQLSLKKLQEVEKKQIYFEQESREKSAFLAMMSHEIRTPLNGVLGMVDLLQHTKLDNQQTLYINTISNSGESLLSILNDILDLSKLEAGKILIEKRPTSLVKLIKDSVALYSRQAQEKNLTMTMNFGYPTIDMLMTDRMRVQQILNNLLSNAIKFTDHGHISIDVSTKEKDLSITVNDTGIGIDNKNINTLFERFTQVHNNQERIVSGSGLGLAICQRLSELLGGEIEVVSEIGQGSSFTLHLHQTEYQLDPADDIVAGCSFFVDVQNEVEAMFVSDMLIRAWLMPTISINTATVALVDASEIPDYVEKNQLFIVDSYVQRLPLKQQIQRPLNSKELMTKIQDLILNINKDAQPKPVNYQSNLIWVGEDNLVNQKVIAGMLRHFKIEFEIFDHGLQLVQAFESSIKLPDLILMDCEMPVMNGYEATKSIHQLCSKMAIANVPIIALTAHLGEEYSREAAKVGMKELITKPLRKQSLEEVLSRWLPDKYFQ